MRSIIFLFSLMLLNNALAQSDSLNSEQNRQKFPVLFKPISGGDFDFHNNWSYQEGVYINTWGQLSCDGLCPMEIDRMKDSVGRIYDDSLTAFYQIIDTTHLFHTISCDASMYEYAGVDFIQFKPIEGGFIGLTDFTIATHSTLTIQIKNQECTAWVDYNSIRADGQEQFQLTKARVLLDEESFKNGIIKGSFDFRFENHLDASFDLWWRGSIYAPVETEEN